MPDNTDIQTQATRDKLNGFTGEAAAGLGIISEAQRAKALEVQARFLALGAQTSGATAAQLADDNAWLQIAENHQVSNEAMLTARQNVQSGAGVGRGFPPLGEIVLALGFVAKEDKNALLAAQAGERTLRATERTRNHFAQGVDESVFVALVKSPKWQNTGKAGDPLYLQAAQAANFKAELLEAAVALAPEMMQNGEVNLQVQQAMASLDGIATTSYMNAAQVLATQHAATAEAVQSAARAGAEAHHVSHPFDFEKTTERMRVADQGMSAVLTYLVEHQKLSQATLASLTSHVEQQSKGGHSR
jgi:hypothetical protein